MLSRCFSFHEHEAPREMVPFSNLSDEIYMLVICFVKSVWESQHSYLKNLIAMVTSESDVDKLFFKIQLEDVLSTLMFQAISNDFGRSWYQQGAHKSHPRRY